MTVVIERRAARVLLLAERSVLLIKGIDPARPDAGSWWLTPGGGVDEGESIEAPENHRWDDIERRSLLDQRCWTVEDLRATDATVYPSELAELVESVLDGNVRDVIRLSGR